MSSALSCIALLALSTIAVAEDLPLDVAVDQATIQDTICSRGWAETVRPPLSVSNTIKRAKLRESGISEDDTAMFDLDYKIPLELGGSPDDPRNRELRKWPEAMEKHVADVCLWGDVCARRLTLDEARHRIWKDWRAEEESCASAAPIGGRGARLQRSFPPRGSNGLLYGVKP
ncbi:hypothetical protein [Methylocystis bryophila]|uniref:Uncharacterized protein n=1 Tax=Methylocystis bryophila TaxID=655015 RepID=A0A1W6MR61_9HYPH|nr:hypothetical protein [Methylocystis bryophila]ARN80065.1 hypothetical protein B1812_02055 [Methylocystis bryophila]BDV39983.1 hypothetical protein DSM21852_32360 [Methylocystis bryophila]